MGKGPENQPVKRVCVGLLAHVDAGKTTLSEALLYRGGRLRKLGRVDHRDAFLDTDTLERERGITIFAKQALLPLGDTELTLLDTPGHVDFSAEMERTLQVLDCAVLVISGTDGVQGHTLTLWRLLARHQIPVFLFVNKMDLAGAEKDALLAQLKSRLNEAITDFTAPAEAVWEEAATGSEPALEEFLETGRLSDATLAALTERRAIFPCWFGSALRLSGVDELLDGIVRYTPRRSWPADFGARVYKISRDPQGTRLTWLKITGGALKVRTPLTNRCAGLSEDQIWEEKADQLRLYSGAKFTAVDRVEAGQVCAAAGLSAARAGEGLGIEAGREEPVLEPVLTYRLILPPGTDPFTALRQLGQLEEEDPQLHLAWDAQSRQIRLQLMGQVQLEVLKRVIQERFGLDVSFDQGGVVYKETIAAAVEGVGHFEPLRHYAEVHLLLEPLERGAGVQAASLCPEDELGGHWQRLILTHLMEKTHRGVLTGSPLTDVRLTLLSGRAHVKHTEGGDFRQATYRAVRQGLMQAPPVLLEPWFDFRLEVPAPLVGRAMTDLQRRGGLCEPPQTLGELALLTGRAPVAGLAGYAAEVAAYTGGTGRLSCVPRGYEPCPDQEKVAQAIGYDPERDTDNTPDSVFCSHGAGFIVRWDQVPQYMHLPFTCAPEPDMPDSPDAGRDGRGAPPKPPRVPRPGDSLALDKELEAIFERTYGPVKRGDFRPQPKPAARPLAENWDVRLEDRGPEYLLVDGYNVIFAWDDLKALARESLDGARARLMELLSNYRGFQKCEVILVFDAWKVPHGTGDVAKFHNIYVVYTKEAETADAYIEKATYELGKKHRVRVVTSDGVEQLIILGHGALRVSARAFRAELDGVNAQISAAVKENNRQQKSRPVQAAMERAKGKAPADV